MRPVASPLFQGLSAEEWAALEQSGCLRAKSYPRHAVIFHAGEQVHALGVVLRGTVHIENLDLWGSKSILSSISAGQAFAETYALCGDVMMVDAVAAEECEVLFVNISAFSGGAPGTVHEKLLRNLDKEIPHGTAVEITRFIERDDEVIEVDATIYCEKASHKGITPKTVRGRLLTYFSAQAARSGSLQFEIPFNRQQLADYLNLDRSALSKELCKMRDEGLLEFEKNHFRLNELPE